MAGDYLLVLDENASLLLIRAAFDLTDLLDMKLYLLNRCMPIPKSPFKTR